VVERDDDKGGAQARNLGAVAAWIGAYNAQDFGGLAAVSHDGFRVEDPATGTFVDGADAFAEIARDVVKLYPDRHISITQMLPLGDSAVAVQGDWDGTAAAATPTGAQPGEAVHHVESMLIELVDGRITLMRIYR
jgi:predicted ester cyclase